MHIAIMEVLAVIGIFACIVWLGRQAMAIADAVSDMYLRWRVRRDWERFEREPRAHHNSGAVLDDRRPQIGGEPVDAEYEVVKR